MYLSSELDLVLLKGRKFMCWSAISRGEAILVKGNGLFKIELRADHEGGPLIFRLIPVSISVSGSKMLLRAKKLPQAIKILEYLKAQSLTDFETY